MDKRRRLLIGGLLIGLMATSATSPILAQDATPSSSPESGQIAIGAPLDLAAMVLLPSEINESGFGLGSGSTYGAETQASYTADVSNVPVAEILETLREAGFVRRYNVNFNRPYPVGMATPVGGNNATAQRVTFSVTEYASAEGAAAGFNLLDRDLEERWDAATSVLSEQRDLPLTMTIGEETDLTAYVGTDTVTGVPYHGLDLTFRVENLVVDVDAIDWVGEPSQGAVETLATRLEERMQTVLATGAPGLSSQVIRLEGAAEPDRDAYLARGGVPIPLSWESADETAARGNLYTAQGITAVYSREQSVGDQAFMMSRLYAFATPEDAATWLAAQPGLTLTSQDFGYLDVTDVSDSDRVGDESRVFSYQFPYDDTLTREGFAVFTRVGAVVARVELETDPELDWSREVAMSLARDQAQCLAAGSCSSLVPQPLPSGMTESTPAATPAS